MTRDDRGGMSGGETPSITHVPLAYPPRRTLAWMPVAAFALGTAVLVGVSVESAWDSPPLLLMLNTLFLAAVSMLVTVLAGQSFLAGQGGSVLLLGCGTLALGFGAVLAGLPPGRSDPNYTATVYNMSALLASICHLASAAWAHRQARRPRRPTGAAMAILYPSVIVLLILGAAAIRAGFLPPFFLDGAGATPLNRAVLWTAAGLFALSAAGLWGRHRRARSTFLRWYALGLTLLAVGLVAVSLQKRFGTPLNWTGRSAQYLGGLYMLIAALSAVRRGQGWTLSLETQLTEARQQYRTLVDLCPEAILVHLDGRYVFANAAALQLFGAARADEFIGRETLSLVHPDDREAVAARMRLTAQDRQTVPAREFTILRLDGTPACVEASAAPIPFHGRQAVQVVLRDVSARKRAEEASRLYAERFERTFHGNAAAMAMTRIEDGCILDVNDRWLELTGLTREEAVGKTTGQLRLWKSPEARAAMAREVLERGVVRGRECVFLRADGSEWTGMLSAQVIDVGGQRVLISSAMDITDRKRAQEAVRESENRLRLALESAGMAAWDWHVPTGRTVWNDEHYRMLGYPVGGVTPGYVAWADRIHPDDRGPTEALLRQAMEQAGEYVAEFRVVWPDASVHWLEARGRFERDPAGAAVRCYGVMLDSTHRKQAQAALRQAVEDLKQSNEDLQQFAYVASHDLQEPLRMVSGFLTLLKDRHAAALDEKAREYIDYSVDGAARMRQLITDLLAYSRVTSKGQAPRPVEAEGALASALANLAARVEEAGAAVTHDPLPTVEGDPGQLAQVFQNLLANAVKFRSPEGPCRIHVGLARLDGEWVFSVRDNGIGIPADSLDRIFKIFERLHTRDKYPGTGIGLAICRKIVERHGGRIWVESAPGEGSTFHFTLPRAAAP